MSEPPPSKKQGALRAAIEGLEVRRPFAAITVTTIADDASPGDGSVSLREAITAINAGNDLGDADIAAQSSGTFGTNDTINFNIPGAGVQTVNVGSDASASSIALPTIIKPLTINGYTQSSASANTLANADNAVILVELNGANAGSAANGLTLGAGSDGSTIKGLTINRFANDGIVVQSNGDTIVGNFIGVDPTGTSRMPNGTFPNSGNGILIDGGSANEIGGTDPADRNVASGNALDGIHIVGSLSKPANQNIIQGNFVGVAADGISSVGNRTEPAPAPGSAEGNNLFGIEISGGNANLVGGTVAGARNVVGYNADGIEVDNGAEQNLIQGNFTGVGADGVTPVGNLLHGIALRSSNGFSAPLGPAQVNEPGVSFNTIGGTVAGAGNLVEFNGAGGVTVFGNPVSASGQPNIANAIEGNSFFQNGRSNPTALLGIDLTNGLVFPNDDGLTPNDSQGHGSPNDPNNFQDFPVITSAVQDDTGTHVNGTLTGLPNSSYRVELFASDPDPMSGIAEGQEFIGFVNVTTNAAGTGSFSTDLAVTVSAGRVITATATDGIGNTSEFSAPRAVLAEPSITVNDVSMTEGNSGTKNFDFTVKLSHASNVPVTVHFQTFDGTAKVNSDYIGRSNTLTIPAGQTSGKVTVLVRGDTTVEPNENFFLKLTSPTNATLSDDTGVGTIINDDGIPPRLSIGGFSAAEGNSGTKAFTFTVTLDQASSKTVTVHFATSNGSATSGSDYIATSGTLSFSAGQTVKTITVLVKGDKTKESDETFFVNLSSAVNANIAVTKGTGTIKNDD